MLLLSGMRDGSWGACTVEHSFWKEEHSDPGLEGSGRNKMGTVVQSWRGGQGFKRKPMKLLVVVTYAFNHYLVLAQILVLLLSLDFVCDFGRVT